MCVGLTFMTYTLYRATVLAPDTHFDKKDRTTQPYERTAQGEEGKKWLEGVRSMSRWNRPGLDVGQVCEAALVDYTVICALSGAFAGQCVWRVRAHSAVALWYSWLTIRCLCSRARSSRGRWRVLPRCTALHRPPWRSRDGLEMPTCTSSSTDCGSAALAAAATWL